MKDSKSKFAREESSPYMILPIKIVTESSLRDDSPHTYTSYIYGYYLMTTWVPPDGGPMKSLIGS